MTSCQRRNKHVYDTHSIRNYLPMGDGEKKMIVNVICMGIMVIIFFILIAIAIRDFMGSGDN